MKLFRIVIHHSSDPSSYNQLERIDTYHKSLGFPKSSLGYYVGYHYLLETGGQVIKTRKHYEIGAHTKGWNDGSLGICLCGDFNISTPTFEQINSLRALLNELCKKYNILPINVSGHKNFRLTSCPGKLLPDSAIRGLIEPPSISQLRLLVDMLTAQVRLLLLKRSLGGSVEDEDLV